MIVAGCAASSKPYASSAAVTAAAHWRGWPATGSGSACSKLTVNRWIAGATRDCAAAVTTALEAFRFDEAAHHLYHFAWGSFCDWYLEFTKPILQGDDDAARAETQATTAWVLAQLVHLLHPVMPFISEELWRQLAGDVAGMLIVGSWPDLPPDLHDPDATAEMDWVVAAISAIRAIRTEVNVPAGARLPLLVKDADPAAAARLERQPSHSAGWRGSSGSSRSMRCRPAASRRWSRAPP